MLSSSLSFFPEQENEYFPVSIVGCCNNNDRHLRDNIRLLHINYINYRLRTYNESHNTAKTFKGYLFVYGRSLTRLKAIPAEHKKGTTFETIPMNEILSCAKKEGYSLED